MDTGGFAVEPFSLPLGEMNISAVIQLDRIANRWDVIVVFSRFPDQAPIQGEEVDVQLLDDHGMALKVLERPSGPLVEAGGSLSTSANALFRFQDSGTTLSELLVTYQVQTVRFRVVLTGEA